MRARTTITLTAGFTAALTAVALAAPARTVTLDAGGPAAAWTGGPISGAAAESDVGDQIPCGPGKECDDTLIKAGARGQLDVKTDSSDPQAEDMDLYLYQSDASGSAGKFIKSSAGGSPKEEVTANVEAGYYLARMVAAASLNGTYTGQAALKALPPVTDEGGPDFGPDPASGLGGSGSGGATTTTGSADDLAPTSKVRAPGERRVRTLTGTATDPDGKIAYVDVAVVRVAARRCSAMTAAGAFKAEKKCAPGPFLRARGGAKWRLALRRALRSGSYVVYARATDDKGRREAGFGPGNRVRFRVR
jgi:hypothetical protein